MYSMCCHGGGGRGQGPGRRFGRFAGRGYEDAPHFGWEAYGGPTKPERKEWLEALKKHLEERLSEVSEELAKA